jgi:hypothetical protein
MPLKPTSKEEEYFAREEAIKLRKLAQKVKAEMSAEERQRLKALHWMRCPKCGLEMKTIKLNQVDVDKCFSCGGIYLDDGELEKVSGRSAEFFKQMKDVLGK